MSKKRLTEDGRVERVLYEGGTREAKLVIDNLQAGKGSIKLSEELPRPPVAGRWIDTPDEDLSE